MKVFWSWQSDTPGKVGRYFVRDSLEQALDDLKHEVDLDEPDREHEDLHLDHDRKGAPGSPDLAQLILGKIRDSSVFVADVTPVGKTTASKDLINANVAIELGYALHVVGNEGFLMVMNEAYGDHTSLPFDLRQKAGPIIFLLPPDATKEQISRTRGPFVGQLKVALRECLNAKKSQKNLTVSVQHPEALSTTTCAQYFQPNETLVLRDMTNAASKELKYETSSLIYLRVIPTKSMPELRGVELADLAYGIKIPPLYINYGEGACHGRNRYGGITYSYEVNDGKASLQTSTQIFHNRELWGIDSILLQIKEKTIPSIGYERVLDMALRAYLQFGREYLGYECPLIVEAGAAQVEGYHMVMGNGYTGRLWGPILRPQIRSRQTLESTDDKDVDSVLLTIFEDFFDATGKRRPVGFRNFPKAVT